MVDGEMPAERGQLMDIGTVAAHNIRIALGLPDNTTNTIRDAIRDEVSAMSSHFTTAVADQMNYFETEIIRIRSTWNYVNANKMAIVSSALAVWVMGFLIGKIS